MNSDSQRHIRFQFWLSDHDGNRILYSEWSDGVIEEADVMLSDRIVDLQHWDVQSGVILNHLVEAGWQSGTMPYGVGDDPIPEILPDHETLQKPASQPVAAKSTSESTRTPSALPGPPGPPPSSPKVENPPLPAPAPAICIFPAGSRPRARRERSTGAIAIICGLIMIGVLIICSRSAIDTAARCTVGRAQILIPPSAGSQALANDREQPSAPMPTPGVASEPAREQAPSLKEPLPVRRALPVEVPRARLVRLPRAFTSST